jgi:hypothetical protein
MPVLTGPLPDVLGRDPHPAVALRGRDHRFEQPAVRLLDLASTSELALRLPQPYGQPVAYPLELGHAKHPRAADGRDAPLDPRSRKGRGEQLSESLLEQRDLAAEVVPGLPHHTGFDALDRGALESRSRLLHSLDLKQLLGQRAPPSTLDGRSQSSPGRVVIQPPRREPRRALGSSLVLGHIGQSGLLLSAGAASINPDRVCD